MGLSHLLEVFLANAGVSQKNQGLCQTAVCTEPPLLRVMPVFVSLTPEAPPEVISVARPTIPVIQVGTEVAVAGIRPSF